MALYQIAGILVSAKNLPDCFNIFLFNENNNALVRLEICEDDLTDCKSVETYGEQQFEINKVKNGNWRLRSTINLVPAEVEIYHDYQKICFHIPPVSSCFKRAQQRRLAQLLQVGFECVLIRHGVLSLHAACVEYNNTAIAFSAPSGVGKSTRAVNWIQSFDACWISGDRPAIRENNGQLYACGVPWDGKEQIFRNAEVPLKAVLEVRRSKKTMIRKLSPRQAERLLAQQCFIPMWDTQTAALALYRIRKLAQEAPIYRAFCDQDKAAAEDIRRILYEHQEEIAEEAADMRIKTGFTLTQVGDEYMVMPTGENVKKFGGAVVLNAVAAFIYRQLEYGICREDLLEQVLNEYEVERETAEKDLDKILETFESYDMIDKD